MVMRSFLVIFIYVVFLAASALFFFFFVFPAAEHALANIDLPDSTPPPALSTAEKVEVYFLWFPFVPLFGENAGLILNIVLVGAVPAWLVHWLLRRRWSARPATV